MKKLGWKPGQGVGPRQSRKEKTTAVTEKNKFYGARKKGMLRSFLSYLITIYECFPGMRIIDDNSDGNQSDEDNDLFEPSVGFAPDDVQPELLTAPKANTFGLGYSPMDRRDVFGLHTTPGSESHLKYSEKNKKVNIRGQVRFMLKIHNSRVYFIRIF